MITTNTTSDTRLQAVDTTDEIYNITEADRADMREILAQRECGELEYVAIEEIKASIQAIISKSQADENKIHS